MPNYCSNCGKRLIDGEGCDCNDAADMHQQSYECPYHQNAGYAQSVNSQWLRGHKQQLTKQVKKVTGEIPGLFKRPDAAIRSNVMTGSHGTALMMVAFKALVLTLILCLVISYIKSRSDILPAVPLRRVILGLITAVVGSVCLQAGIVRGTVQLFKGQTTFQKMLSAAGISALVDGLYLALGALLMLVIPRLGALVILSGVVLSQLFYLKGYSHGVDLPQDKKLYCLAAARVIYLTTAAVITYTAIPIMTNSSISGLLNHLLIALG